MSTEAVRRLRATWQGDRKLQQAIEAAFDDIGFDDRYLTDCATQSRYGDRKRKYIKDNVWGMVELEWATIRLLDCPVVQRLRGIKQLGFSYVTYPSAEHSRFIHSLGMASVIYRFLASIEKRSGEHDESIVDAIRFVGSNEIKPIEAEEIVHAAILHDVGHMPFSHASEKVLEGFEELFTCGTHTVADIRYQIGDILRKPLAFSEILSILIVLSNRFEKFYSVYVCPGGNASEALLRIACLIAGTPPEARLSGVAELISSAAIDADKIDYVNRDAGACGIPVGVDVSRVFLRSGFIIATRDQLKRANLKDDPAPEEVVFVVNASGMDTVDEITQARAALYQRVYLHAVTRGSEALLARALAANLESTSRDARLGDALGLWSLCDDVLLSKLVTARDRKVADFGGRLYGRRLLKKACVFSTSVASMHMPVESLFARVPFDLIVVEKQIVNTPLEGLSSQSLSSGRDRELEAEIIAEARAVVSKLPLADRPDLIPRSPLEVVIVLGTAYMDRVRKDCIVLQNGELLRTSNFTPVREQQDAFDIFKAVGYVMCEAEWRPIVLIAARTVLSATMSTPQRLLLKEDYEDDNTKQKGSEDEVSFVARAVLDLNAVIRRSGVGRQVMKRVMTAATEGGYFDDKPLLAETTDEGSAAVQQIAEKLRTFEGQRSWRVREETVARFVDQFPPRLRREMLEALARIVFFDATELRTSVLNKAAELSREPTDVAPLSANSGHHVRMVIEQEAKGRSRYSHLTFRKSLREALDETGTRRTIVLVDDNISSATQARAQFLRWVGVSRENWPEECKDEDGIADETLTEAQLDELRPRALHIVTCVGRPLAEENLRPILTKHGLTFHGVKWKHPAESVVKWSEDLKGFLCESGTSLIAWSKYRKDPSELDAVQLEYCKGMAFGYGNVGSLVATASNVPTATVTAIWSPGMYRGNPWMPLMIRRNKLRHLVLG